MKYLKRFLMWLVYLLPAALYCSYYPIIKLGESDSMNFELSLPLIWLIIFDLTTFVALISIRKKLPKFGHKGPKRQSRTRLARAKAPIDSANSITDRQFFLFSLLPFFATLSIFWSPNPTRAILTAGIIWLTFFAVFALIYVLPLLKLPTTFRTNCLRTFFISTIVICLVCWVQCFLDILGLDRNTILMCRGCTSSSFGFPHPSGLAIEPQFMGNLLLAPTLTALYLLIFGSKTKQKNVQTTIRKKSQKPDQNFSQLAPKTWRLIALSTLFSATLFLTFSRGAIYAYIIALIVLLVFALRRHCFRLSLVTIPVATFVFVLAAQGLFTILGPTHGTFFDGVSRSLHQLSLGIIDVRPSESSSDSTSSNAPTDATSPNSPTGADLPGSTDSTDATSPTNPTNSPTHSTTNDTVDEDPEEQPTPHPSSSTSTSPIFEGYVPESTNARLDLNAAAIDTWLSAPGHPQSNLNIGLRCLSFCCPCTGSSYLTPTSIFFGVGLGGAGISMHRNSFITGINSPKEIVQNQFFSLLLELGLIGVFLALLGLYLAFFSRSARSRLKDHPMLPLLVSLVLAYLVTLSFFSGLPNALQIYLMPPFLYMIFTVAERKTEQKKPSATQKNPSEAHKNRKKPL